jgi:hypothetical protein
MNYTWRAYGNEHVRLNICGLRGITEKYIGLQEVG